MIAIFFLFLLQNDDLELQSSVRVGNASGTVIKVSDGFAYILTTGHLEKRQDVKVEFFYMDGDKLEKPMVLSGRIILLLENNEKGVDFSIVKIELPKRSRPSCIPLASKEVRCRKNQNYRVIGFCKEPCEFELTYLGERDGSLITTKDKPTPGCSGGGLFRGGKLLGVCWGTNHKESEIEGLFTPHYSIIDILEKANMRFLFE